MPRELDPDLLSAMNSGNFVPYFKVQLMDVDHEFVSFQTTEVIEFALEGLTARVVFHDPTYWDDYYMFRIQRGILVNGVPNVITSSCYWPYYDRHENHVRTLEGHVFPNEYFSTPGDVSYQTVIEAFCAQFGFTATYEDPVAAWLDYQFFPDDKNVVVNNARTFFNLLHQKYLIFATDASDDVLYFFQAKQTAPAFPDDYTLVIANDIQVPGHGAYKEKTLFSRDENNTVTTSGGVNRPYHNLGFLEAAASQPDNYSWTDTQNWIIKNIAPNLKYLDFDPIYVTLDFGNFSIWPAKFVEIYNSKLKPSWQWQARFLEVFSSTEGGGLPQTIEAAAPFTPLSTLHFNKNLDWSVNNLQALADAVDDHDHTDQAFPYTVAQTIDVESTAALLVQQSGVYDSVLVVDTVNCRVGIGTPEPAATLHVFADQDAIQFIVQAGTGQTANLTEWQDVDTNVLGGVSYSGVFFLGPASIYSKGAIQIDITQIHNSYLDILSFTGHYTLVEETEEGWICSVSLWPNVIVPDTFSYCGIYVSAYSLTVTSGFGIFYGVYIEQPWDLTGSLSFSYGLLIGNINQASTNYAIYSNAGLIHFGDSLDFSSGKNITFIAGNIITDTTTGTKIGTATTQKLGFFNATPIVQPSAYTQTYAVADKTHANPTSATLTDNTGGSANTTLESVPAAYSQSATRNNFADLCAMTNKLTADMLDVKQMINAIVDDLQSLGLVG